MPRDCESRNIQPGVGKGSNPCKAGSGATATARLGRVIITVRHICVQATIMCGKTKDDSQPPQQSQGRVDRTPNKLREPEVQRLCRRYDRVKTRSNTKAATGELSRCSSPTRVLYEGCLFCSLTRGPGTPRLPTYCKLHVAIPARRAWACRKELGFSIHHFSAP